MWSRRVRVRAGVWCVCAVLALLLAAMSVTRRAAHRTQHRLPRAHPARLAHLLADFTFRHPGVRFHVEEERNNLTSWKYEVRYECGARCRGAATLSASSDSPAHDRASQHRLHEIDTRCRPLLPLLSWPETCEWCEVEQSVRDEGQGAVVRCGARCGGGWLGAARDPRDLCDYLLRRLQHALTQT